MITKCGERPLLSNGDKFQSHVKSCPLDVAVSYEAAWNTNEEEEDSRMSSAYEETGLCSVFSPRANHVGGVLSWLTAVRLNFFPNKSVRNIHNGMCCLIMPASNLYAAGFANGLIIYRVIWTQEFYGVSLLMPTANGARNPFMNTLQTDCKYNLLTLESCRFMRLRMLNAQFTFRRISKRGWRLAEKKLKLSLDSRVLWGL